MAPRALPPAAAGCCCGCKCGKVVIIKPPRLGGWLLLLLLLLPLAAGRGPACPPLLCLLRLLRGCLLAATTIGPSRRLSGLSPPALP